MKKDIAAIEEKLNSPEYANLEIQSHQLEQEINDKNKYFYALSEMKATMEQTVTADSALLDDIKKNIPNEAYIESYMLTGNTLTIKGYTFDYYSANEIVHLFEKDKDLFTSAPDIHVQTVDNSSVGGSSSGTGNNAVLNVIDRYYVFEIVGTISGREVFVSYSSYVMGDSVTPLGAIQSVAIDSGATYEIENVGSLQRNGVDYQLTNVTINDVGVDADQLSTIIATNKVTVSPRDNIEVKLYYSVVETTEEGEA